MKTDFQGITYNQVKNILQEVTNQIPALDTVCSEFTVSNSIGSHSETTVIKADVGHIKIDLSVTYDNNAYIPVLPVEGQWSTIEKLLRQLTKDYGEEYYQMLLDYLTLTYVKPMQRLPILVLSSSARGVGKTSFLYLLEDMYNKRCVVGGWNLVFPINSLIVNKLIIGIDESGDDLNEFSIDLAKNMCTSRTIELERKGQDREVLPFFGKFIMCTNSPITDSKKADRIWNIAISPWATDEEFGGNFRDKITLETPAFLFYLKQRWEQGEMYVKKPEDLLWFSRERYNK